MKEEIRPEELLMNFFGFRNVQNSFYEAKDIMKLRIMLDKIIAKSEIDREELVIYLGDFINKLHDIKTNLDLNAETIFAILEEAKGEVGREINYLWALSKAPDYSKHIKEALDGIPTELSRQMLRGSGKNFYSIVEDNISAIDNIANSKELIMDLIKTHPNFYLHDKVNICANLSHIDFERDLLSCEKYLNGRPSRKERKAFIRDRLLEANKNLGKEESPINSPTKTAAVSFNEEVICHIFIR